MADLGNLDTAAGKELAGGGVVLFSPGKYLVWTDRKKVKPYRD